MTPDSREQDRSRIVDSNVRVQDRLKEHIKHLKQVKQELAFFQQSAVGSHP